MEARCTGNRVRGNMAQRRPRNLLLTRELRRIHCLRISLFAKILPPNRGHKPNVETEHRMAKPDDLEAVRTIAAALSGFSPEE